MKKRFLRFAFVLVLAAAGSLSQSHAIIVPPTCHTGQACTTDADCGNCTRCGYFCWSGACVCFG